MAGACFGVDKEGMPGSGFSNCAGFKGERGVVAPGARKLRGQKGEALFLLAV